MKRLALEKRKQSIGQLRSTFTDQTGIQIGRTTITHRLKEGGISVYRCQRKPLMSIVNKKKRKAWVGKHWDNKKKQMITSLDYFRKVIWSDESRFCLISDRPQNCLRRQGEEFRPDCLQSTEKFAGGGIMVWGCLSSAGVGPIVWIKSTVNAEVYKEILEQFLIDMIDNTFPDGDCIFQQDNTRCHIAKTVMTWFKDKKINVIEDWPAKSPDLNIIENIWDNIGRKIEKKHFTNQRQLWEAVKTAWYQIKPDEIEKLILSIPNRFKGIAKSGGGAINY